MAAVQELGDALKTVADVRVDDGQQFETTRAARRSFIRSDTEGSRTITDSEKMQSPNEKNSRGGKVTEAEGEQATPSRSAAMARKERWQLFSLCFSLFLAGWDGGTPGPLIPRLQIFYNVCELRLSVSHVSLSFLDRLSGRFAHFCFQLYCESLRDSTYFTALHMHFIISGISHRSSLQHTSD